MRKTGVNTCAKSRMLSGPTSSGHKGLSANASRTWASQSAAETFADTIDAYCNFGKVRAQRAPHFPWPPASGVSSVPPINPAKGSFCMCDQTTLQAPVNSRFIRATEGSWKREGRQVDYK
jgi:hypothetical protein